MARVVYYHHPQAENFSLKFSLASQADLPSRQKKSDDATKVIGYPFDTPIYVLYESDTEIEDAIEDAGYGAVSETVTIAISDMTCANCAETNESALEATPGVIDAEVNYATDEGQITYNPADTSLDALYDAIEDAGYSPVREDSDDCRVLVTPAYFFRPSLRTPCARLRRQRLVPAGVSSARPRLCA